MKLTSQHRQLIQVSLGLGILVVLYFLFIREPQEGLEDVSGNSLPAPIVMMPSQSLAPEVEYEEPPEEDPVRLLPQYDESEEFAEEHPIKSLLKEQNYLVGGYPIGINTSLQSNKIPYLDIRSLPPIPKEHVWPINQSSYEQSPGQTRRGFELGQ